MCLTIRAACGHWSLMNELLLLRQALWLSSASAEVVQRRLNSPQAGLVPAHSSTAIRTVYAYSDWAIASATRPKSACFRSPRRCRNGNDSQVGKGPDHPSLSRY